MQCPGIIACFPEKFPGVPIPGEISRFPEQFWLCPETAFVRVVTPVISTECAVLAKRLCCFSSQLFFAEDPVRCHFALFQLMTSENP